jgi:hypothetical protein
MIIILKMNPAEYSCELQGFPSTLQFAISRSDVECLLTGIHCGVQPLESPNCLILIRWCSRERTSADVCLNQSLGYYMKMTLTIMSCSMVSITIPGLLTVKWEILLCSR